MIRAAFISLALLAGCGADGEPEPVNPGITIGGSVGIGVSGSL